VAIHGAGKLLFDTSSQGALALFHAGMVQFNEAGDVQPQLAEAAPTLENGLWKVFPDGRMETRMAIRQGARWHDGHPFTTTDLLLGAAYGTQFPDPQVGSAAYEAIEKLDAIDDRTIVVTWSRPYINANFLFSVAGNVYGAPLPEHLMGESFRQDPTGIVNHPYWTTDYVGNGAFVVRSFDQGTSIRLEAFDDFVMGRPKIDSVTVKFFPNVDTLTANVLAGEVDLTLGPSLSVEQSQKVVESWADGEMIYSKYFATQVTAAPQFVNPDPPIQANVEFRRALAHAIDRDAILQTIQSGIGGVASALVSPTDSDFQAVKGSIAEYAYDPRRASQLIDSLGFSKGADGYYRDASGAQLAVPVWTNGGDAIYERTTTVVADYWKRVGVFSEPRVVPPGSDPSVLPSRPAFTLAALKTQLDARYLSTQIPLPENRFRGSNSPRYASSELDALINRYFVTVPQAERASILADIVKHMTENVVVIHLFYNVTPQLKNKHLQNVTPRTVQARILDAQRWEWS